MLQALYEGESDVERRRFADLLHAEAKKRGSDFVPQL